MRGQLPHDLTKQVVDQQVLAWAEISGDYNRLHVDRQYAATTRYAEPILHGHLIIAWIMEWAMAWAGNEWMRRGRISQLRYLAPLHPGVEYVIRGLAGESDDGIQIVVLLPNGKHGVEAELSLPSEASHDED